MGLALQIGILTESVRFLGHEMLSQMLHVWNLCRSVGVVWGVNVGIYGSPMERLGIGLDIWGRQRFDSPMECPGWAFRRTRRLPF